MPPIVQTLGTSMGMTVTTILAELTLAERLPPLAQLTPKAKASLTAARDEARALAAKLSGSEE